MASCPLIYLTLAEIQAGMWNGQTTNLMNGSTPLTEAQTAAHEREFARLLP